MVCAVKYGVFWPMFGIIAGLRLLLAAQVPLFGDEAFYWQESQRLAAGYSDLPPGTAWLIAAGMAVAGDSLLALRLPFVLAGLATVLLVRALLLKACDRQAADRGGLVALLMPIGQAVGVLAIPDVVLTLCFITGAFGLVMARGGQGWRGWLVFGLALAAAWLVHWRTAMIYAGGVLLLWRDAQPLWRDPRHWLAQGIGLLGLVPSLWFNAAQDWPALRFQAVDRHDWGFHVQGLLMPLEQAVVVSPLVFGMALLAVRRGAGDAAVAIRTWTWLGLGLFAAYLVIGCFADQERTRVHWPAPAFLLLVPALATWLATRPRAWPWVAGTAALGSAIVFAGLAVLWLRPAWTEPFGKRFGANFTGYAAVAEAIAPMRHREPNRVLVADNFLLGAQLDWHLGETPYVLDAPRNAEHGRAVQLGLWQRDEAALRRADPESMLLVVDDSALFAGDRFGFHASLCKRLGGMRFAGERLADEGRRRFTIWHVDRDDPRCEQPILSLLFPIEHRLNEVIIAGFAVQHLGRVRAVTLERDGVVIATDVMDDSGPIVDTHWEGLEDGNGRHVGFRFELARAMLGEGSADYRLVAEADDGQQREVARFRMAAAWQGYGRRELFR